MTAPRGRGDQGHPDRGPAGEKSECDARQRDVTHAVAHQSQPALNEEDADARSGQPDEHSGQECALHEVVLQELHRHGPRRHGGGQWVVGRVVGVVVVGERLAGGQQDRLGGVAVVLRCVHG